MIKFELETYKDKSECPLVASLDIGDGDLNLMVNGTLICFICSSTGKLFRHESFEEDHPAGFEFENCGKIKIGDDEDENSQLSYILPNKKKTYQFLSILEDIRIALVPTNPPIFERVMDKLRMLENLVLDGDS